jgi:hypothetical protein
LVGRTSNAFNKDNNILSTPPARRSGTTHYDLYDKTECIDQAVAKLNAFYGENL